MNPQEFFDKTLDHLRKQGRPAKVRGNCKYRLPQPDGSTLMCAIGCHLTDDAYHPDMEGASVYRLLAGDARGLPTAQVQRLRGLLEGIHPSLARRMQSLHDELDTDEGGRFNFEQLEGRAKRVAGKFGLTYAPPAAEA